MVKKSPSGLQIMFFPDMERELSWRYPRMTRGIMSLRKNIIYQSEWLSARTIPQPRVLYSMLLILMQDIWLIPESLMEWKVKRQRKQLRKPSEKKPLPTDSETGCSRASDTGGSRFPLFTAKNAGF